MQEEGRGVRDLRGSLSFKLAEASTTCSVMFCHYCILVQYFTSVELQNVTDVADIGRLPGLNVCTKFC